MKVSDSSYSWEVFEMKNVKIKASTGGKKETPLEEAAKQKVD